jgi:hypothetical protein
MATYHPCIFVIRILNKSYVSRSPRNDKGESSDESMNRPTVCTTSVGGSIDLHWGNPNWDDQIIKKAAKHYINFF